MNERELLVDCLKRLNRSGGTAPGRFTLIQSDDRMPSW